MNNQRLQKQGINSLKIMKTMKKILAAAAAVAFMALIAAALVLYQAGYYDISFIARPVRDEAAKETGSDIALTEARESEHVFAQGDNLGAVFDTGELGSADSAGLTDEPKKENLTVLYTDELEEAGYQISVGLYDAASHKIGKIRHTISFPRKLQQSDGSMVLSMYMGYILYNDGTHTSALRADGTVAVAGIEHLSPAYMRDSAGKALFMYGGEYYRLVDGTNQMEKIQVDPLFAPALIYNSPQRETENPTGLYRYYVIVQEERKINANGTDITDDIAHKLSEAEKDGKDINDPEVYDSLRIPEYTIEYRDCIRWGYTNSRGAVAIEAQYYFAADFDENGYAVVADRYGVARVINRYGSNVISLNSRILYLEERNRRPAFENYYIPDQTVTPADLGLSLELSSGYIGRFDGVEKIGMFAFDHGLMRMRYMLYDHKNETEVVRDEDVLIRMDGSRFEFPADYSLRAYSDGILLLEKDGRFGYMDYTGKWIVQPIYTYAHPFMQGLAVVGFADGMKAVIDTKGNLVLPFDYSYISDCSSGIITAFAKSTWHIFNIMSQA